MSEAYKRAGVDIDAGNEAVERMKTHVRKTLRPEVLTGLGGFGGLFQLNTDAYEDPVLVSGTDGVGTKLKLAFAADRHDTIGTDAVAMCVNDIVVQGAEPLFFLDYLACGEIAPEKVEMIVKGVTDGCQEAGCALIGGETAEMPGMYAEGEYDIAGFSVGIVDRTNLIDGSRIGEGDAVIGLASNGVHSNGFSLVRKVLLEEQGLSLSQRVSPLDRPLGDELLTPTRIYVRPLLQAMAHHDIKGMAHVTGGGFYDNIPRMLPKGTGVEIEHGSWPIPPIFQVVQEYGGLTSLDMYRTLNMGIGMILVVGQAEADDVMQRLREVGESPYRIGKVIPGNQDVRFGGEST